MRQIIATMMGMSFEFKIAENRCYLKCPNAMARTLFKQVLSQKGGKPPEAHGDWDLYEVEGANEAEVTKTLVENLEKTGMTIASDKEIIQK